MNPRRIGARQGLLALAATCSLFVCASTARAQDAASSAPAMASPETTTQLNDGLTLVTRKATASPTAALEVWIKCPSSGYGAPRPGLARLTALAIVEQKSGGSSLRTDARAAGAQVAVSVYHESTEIAILAPSYVSGSLLDKLVRESLHPQLDQKAFDAARQRLAAQQVASLDMPDEVLRDSLFARIFASGPLHDSSYGDPRTLTGLTLADVTSFATRAYVPADEIVVAVGGVDVSDVAERTQAAAPAAAPAVAIPESSVASYTDAPLSLTRSSIDVGGVALGWPGPPIADERAATAMDFLSDYLTHPTEGVLSKIVNAAASGADFSGQFVTLRNPGVFYVTASGDKVDPTITVGIIRDAMRDALRKPLSDEEFARARTAYVNHLLGSMQTAQSLADNYGWYFSQGALPYSPSSTDAALSGQYFTAVQSLTPQYVYSIASRYLQAKPAVVILPRGPIHVSGGP
ncbi:MAG: insulinase family protein [Candidatus Eremiobacteraeota bacterium]|nr:insulinase family protein [Candidatus Eremiobacteraeota bacterium]